MLAVEVVTAVAQLGDVPVARIGALPCTLPVPALPDLSGLGACSSCHRGRLPRRSGEPAVRAGRRRHERCHPPRSDRELFGQGLANIAAGLCGGVPATGAITRTAVNARAGAHTRLAALTHRLVLAAVVYAASGLVGRIPLVALAGVLLVTAYRMVERRDIRTVLHSTRDDVVVLSLTAVATVAFDLVRAVELGLLAATVLTLARLSRTAQATAEPVMDDGLASDEEHALLRAVGALTPVLAQNHVFDTWPDAVAHARRHVSRLGHDDGGSGLRLPAVRSSRPGRQAVAGTWACGAHRLGPVPATCGPQDVLPCCRSRLGDRVGQDTHPAAQELS